MNPSDLHTGLIETLSLSLPITSVAAVEMRRISFSITAYLCQALLIVAPLLSFAPVNRALYWWAATAIVTKATFQVARRGLKRFFTGWFSPWVWSRRKFPQNT